LSEGLTLTQAQEVILRTFFPANLLLILVTVVQCELGRDSYSAERSLATHLPCQPAPVLEPCSDCTPYATRSCGCHSCYHGATQRRYVSI